MALRCASGAGITLQVERHGKNIGSHGSSHQGSSIKIEGQSNGCKVHGASNIGATQGCSNLRGIECRPVKFLLRQLYQCPNKFSTIKGPTISLEWRLRWILLKASNGIALSQREGKAQALVPPSSRLCPKHCQGMPSLQESPTQCQLKRSQKLRVLLLPR